MEFEDLLREVGDCGRYQRSLILWFLFPTALMLPWFSMNLLFMTSVPDHWCAVPELDSANLSLADRHLLTRPTTSTGPSHCEVFAANYSAVLSTLSDNWTSTIRDRQRDWPTRSCAHGWQFDNNYYDATIATKWNLFCDRGHLNSLILTMNNVGCIIGTPIYGSLSDRIGRRLTFFIVVLVSVVSGMVSFLVPSFIAFVVLRVINGSLMPSIFQVPYIILVELVGPTKRTHMNGIANSSWTLGFCMLPLIAYLSRHWVTFGLITTSVTFLFFFYWKFLPESPRWLVTRDRYEEASIIMEKISRKNNKTSHTKAELLQKIQKLGENMKRQSPFENNVSIKVFLQFHNLRKKFLIVTLLWTSATVSYYGLQLNVSNLYGNQFLNFFLLTIIELPGQWSSWLFMEKFGRRWCSVFFLILIGIACILPALLPPELHLVGVIASLVGKYGAAGAFMSIYQQAAEVFPTPVRAIGMGLSGTIAACSMVVTPYLIYLAEYGKIIPFATIGGLSILAGIAAAFLPETLNANLPQTIQDGENFGKDQKFFSCVKKKPKKSEKDQEEGKKKKGEIPKTLSPVELIKFVHEPTMSGTKSKNMVQGSSQVKEGMKKDNATFSSCGELRKPSLGSPTEELRRLSCAANFLGLSKGEQGKEDLSSSLDQTGKDATPSGEDHMKNLRQDSTERPTRLESKDNTKIDNLPNGKGQMSTFQSS